MVNKRTSVFIAIQILLVSWTAIGIASGSSDPTTTISFQTPHDGELADGKHVFVGRNPIFSLTYNLSNNSTWVNTEYEVTSNGNTTSNNYTNPVTLWANHSITFNLKYRSNSTTGLEGWKTLNVSVDADYPELDISSSGGEPLRYISNQSIYVTTPTTPLNISCTDDASGVDTITGSIGPSVLTGSNGVLSLTQTNLPSGINGNSSFSVNISCSDKVDNYRNQTLEVIVDDSTPTLTTIEHGVRVGQCISDNWWLSVQSSDNHSSSYVEMLNSSGSWIEVNESIGVTSNFNGTITTRAHDEAGYFSVNTTFNVTVDTLLPSLSASLNASTLSVNSTDSCGVSSILARWETLVGTTTGWITLQGGFLSIPNSLNGSIVRAQVRSTDVIGNTANLNTAWVNTNGSSPYSTVTVLSNRLGSVLSSNSIFLLTPVGHQAVANWNLLANNQSLSSGNTSTQIIMNNNFSHGDLVKLFVNTTDSLGDNSSYNWTWTVDGSNSHQIVVSAINNYINSSVLVLGSSGRLRLSPPSDDASGVGGSHALCTWNGQFWFNSTSGALFTPAGTANTIQSFIFGCRSVDLLGNKGPITWLNGSVDLEIPLVTLQPNAGVTVCPSSTIMVNMSDINGISSAFLSSQWTNGTASSWSNMSLGSTNWSATISQLFSNYSDGTITVNIVGVDALGNSAYLLGRTWSLNTSQPLISVILSGDFHGTFISSNGTEITLIPPSGGWNGIWMNYTLTNNSGGLIMYDNVTTTTNLQPSALPPGNVWLNTTVGESLGRSQSQGWVFTVDNQNLQVPTLEIVGSNTTINGTKWIGPSAKFRIHGINDDSSGVGPRHASCSWDGASWFNTRENELLSPSVTSGTHQALSLRCRNVDLLSNQGPLRWINTTADYRGPTQSLTPSSSQVIAPNTQITVNVNDSSGITQSVLYFSWTNGQNIWTHNVTIATTNWSSALSSLNNSLTDGSISLTLITWDVLGNQATYSGHYWTLNTTQPLSSVIVTGSVVSNYVGSDGFSIYITPPSLGGYAGWAEYSLEHSNGTTITSGNSTSSIQLTPNQLPSGQIWLNISSHDAFNRSQNQSWMYHVDSGVGTLPIIGLQGTYLNQSGNPILGPNGRLKIISLHDDQGGVGASHASCTWNGQDWFSVNQNGTLSTQYSSGSIQTFSLGCSVVDLLDNVGTVQWRNGTVDVQAPTITFNIGSGSLLSDNSTFNVSCSDSSGCGLISIAARFNNGSSNSWYSISLGGPSSSVYLSTLLNVSESGTLTFFVNSEDYLDNSINQSSSNFQYLHGTPTVSLTIQSNHSGAYVNGNLSFLVTPSVTWSSGITVNLTVEQAGNQSRLFDGMVNQSTSNQNYYNLSEGGLWSNSTICDALSRCSTTSILQYVDLTGPSTPLYSITDGYLLSNQSRIAQGSAAVNVSEGLDSGSGVSRTVCIGSNGQVTFSTQQVSIFIQSLVPSGVWSNIRCYSIDSVGNNGTQFQLTLRRDDTAPQFSLNDNSISSVITPSKWYNATCTDETQRNLLNLEIESNETILYQTNTTGDISIRYGTLSTLGAGSHLTFTLNCSDAAGNYETDSRILEWLPALDASTISVTGLINGENSYVTTAQTVSLSNPRSDVYHEVRYILNGTYGNWMRVNSTSFALNSLNTSAFENGMSLQIGVRVLMDGTLLTNSSLSTLMYIDLVGPTTSLVSNPTLSNGSIINLSSQDTGVGISLHLWSWDNGTVQQSTSLSYVRLPVSSSSSSWLSIHSVDRLGNTGNWLNTSIYRDLSPPLITINSSHPGHLGPNSFFDVEITESTGLAWSTLRLNSPNGQMHFIANNTNSYRVLSSNLPNWAWNYSTLYLVVRAESSSGLLSVYNLSITPDNVAPTVSIDTSQSTNLYGQNTSNNTALLFSESTDTSESCVKIGQNVSSALATECLSPSNSEYRYQRGNGQYVIVVNATDFAGNTRMIIFYLHHHTEIPIIYDITSNVVRPGSSLNYNYSSTFISTVRAFWDGATLNNQGGVFTIPAGTGTHNLTLNVTDATGLSNERSWSLTLDGTAPTISLQGNFYASTIFGTDTILYINSSDALSLISMINLTVSSTSQTCWMEWQPISASFSINGTLSDLIYPNLCPLLQTNTASVTVAIIVEDSVGNIYSDSLNMQYHGGILPPTWTITHVINAPTYVWVSQHSNFTCNEAIGSIEPVIELNWTGSGGIITESNLSDVSSSGVLICNVVDFFGNSAVSSLNLSFDSTTPTISLSWPIGNHGYYVRAGFSDFTLNASDSETGITSMMYCISQTYCTPTTSTNGSIPTNSGNGSRNLFVIAINGVGIESTSNLSYTQDNSPPTLNVESNSNVVIDNTVIFVGTLNPNLNISMLDDLCIEGGRLTWDNGNYSISNNSIQQIPTTATWLSISVEDCVGHSITHTYSIQLINSISATNLSIHPAHIGTALMRNGTLIHDGSIVLIMSPTHQVQLQVQCNGSSPSVTVTCDIPGQNNVFDVILNSTDWQGSVELEFTDLLGNSMTQSINFSSDTSYVTCTPLQYVQANYSVLTMPSTRSTQFTCMDNLSGIRSVSWQAPGTTVSWIPLQNGTWSAPPPPSSSSSLVTVDEVGNIHSESYIIIFDDLAPVLNFTSTSGISFDENMARPDGSFEVSCVDLHLISCIISITQRNHTSNIVYTTQILYDSGNIALPLPSNNEIIQIDITVEDAIGNNQSFSKLLLIDSVAPEIILTARSPLTNEPLPLGIIANDGIITIDNLVGSDVNYSLSRGISLYCVPNTEENTEPILLYNEPLQSLYDFSNYQFGGCEKIFLNLSADDHVGNEYSNQWIFAIDYLYPSVTYTLDENCSWYSGTHYDMQSSCIIKIDLSDDQNQNLAGIFIIEIRSAGVEVGNYPLYQSKNISLNNILNQSIVISVVGSDKVGREISSNSLHVKTQDEVKPIWTGLICSGNLECGWSDGIIGARIGGFIGVTTLPEQAPIVISSFTFENTLNKYEFNSTNFSALAIPDGTYMLTPKFIDAAGRVFNEGIISFIYDNQAPIIEIIQTQSNGILNDSLILSCDICKLVWRVNETTDYVSTTNHGSYPEILGQYSMSTATLTEYQIIRITATDAFGRISMMEFNTTPIRTTTIDPIEDLLIEDGVNLLCMETTAIEDVRQVTCLWQRSGSLVGSFPIRVEVEIDRSELRDVDLVIEKSGGSIEVINLDSGIIILPRISHYISSFDLHVIDKFSEVNSIHFTLIEHTLPWSSNMSLDESSLSEDSYNSTFGITIYPPSNEGEYHILKRGQIELEELFNCSSEYVFAQLDDYSQTAKVTNCNIINWRIKPDGGLLIEVFIDHHGVRNTLELSNHSAPLFNLEQFSIIFAYEDPLGVIGRTTSDVVTFRGDEIIRTVDSGPILIPSNNCPLGQDSIEFGSNGFLQSDGTAPLAGCSNNILDSDGINRIIWNITFESGSEEHIVEVECKMTFFPPNWNFQDAIDSNLCEYPSTEFPTGVFDVTIQPWLVDESVYVGLSDDFRWSPDGSHSKRVRIAGCAENSSCQFAEYVLIDVAVSSNLNPATDVENSMLLVGNAQNFIASEMFWILLVLLNLFFLGAIFSLYKIRRNNKSIVSTELESEDGEGESTELNIKDYWWTEKTLANILEEFDIHDKDAFLDHAIKFDYDENKYLSKSELHDAAGDWNKQKMDLEKSILKGKKEKSSDMKEKTSSKEKSGTSGEGAESDNDEDDEVTPASIKMKRTARRRKTSEERGECGACGADIVMDAVECVVCGALYD